MKKESFTVEELVIEGYEKVIYAENRQAGLRCYIAIHNSTLGPALGGTRIYPYKTLDEALEDVLRLSRAMTYKSAIAQDGLGGGKAVILADPKHEKTDQLLEAFGEVVHSLGGQYIAAEDVGTTPEDMKILQKKTPFVAALPSSSGDPSRFTAYGVFIGIQTVLEELYGTPDLTGKKVAIQGLGNVGSKLARHLFWAGADLLVSDLDSQLARQMARSFGAKLVDPAEILTVEADLLAPCALGGILHEKSIPRLRVQAIAGGANNQLVDSEAGVQLFERKILFAPDFVINAGGILNASTEFDTGGYSPQKALQKVRSIPKTLRKIFLESKKRNIPPNFIAVELAEHNLKNQIGKREVPILFS